MNNESGFQEVFKDNYSLLVKISVRICGTMESAEEVVQEAFLKYHERMNILPQGMEARYWLIRVVKNLSLNIEKRKGRERKAYEKYLKEPTRSSVNQGEVNTLKEETRQIVQEALMELPYKLRVILVLKEYAKFTYKEIGDILKISEGNVKVRVFRARKMLGELIDKGEVYVP